MSSGDPRRFRRTRLARRAGGRQPEGQAGSDRQQNNTERPKGSSIFGALCGEPALA